MDSVESILTICSLTWNKKNERSKFNIISSATAAIEIHAWHICNFRNLFTSVDIHMCMYVKTSRYRKENDIGGYRETASPQRE